MGVTFEDLTDEQKARFNRVMEKLKKLEVPELLAETARLRLPKPITPELKPRYRSNFSGAIAAQKVLAYINELHAANDRRIELYHEINRIKKDADELESSDPEKAQCIQSNRGSPGRNAGSRHPPIRKCY